MPFLRPLWRLAFALASLLLPFGAMAAQSVASSSLASPALQPGDIVRLRIWREPDLSGDFPVDETGVVTFPKLGEISVIDESTESLKAKLVSAYKEYLRNPSIDVVLLRRVNILGAVRTPGLYPVDPTMTVADALALAGGATPDGDRQRVDVIRRGERTRIRLADAARIADLSLRSGDQLFVPDRRWAARNQGVIAASISAGASLLIAVFLTSRR
jgi:protein involved in polysaccharide export with SLBB domain